MPAFINQNNDRSVALLQQGGPVKYAGLNGQSLLAAVVAIGTCGFALFGYGEFLDASSRCCFEREERH